MPKTRLNALGFSKVIRPTINATSEAIHAQIESNPEIADRVLAEVQEDSAPFIVDKENYELFLDNWVETQSEALHLMQY